VFFLSIVLYNVYLERKNCSKFLQNSDNQLRQCIEYFSCLNFYHRHNHKFCPVDISYRMYKYLLLGSVLQYVTLWRNF